MTDTTEVKRNLPPQHSRNSYRRGVLMGAVVNVLLNTAAKAVTAQEATVPQGISRNGADGPPSARQQEQMLRGGVNAGYERQFMVRTAAAKMPKTQKVYGPQKHGGTRRGR